MSFIETTAQSTIMSSKVYYIICFCIFSLTARAYSNGESEPETPSVVVPLCSDSELSPGKVLYGFKHNDVELNNTFKWEFFRVTTGGKVLVHDVYDNCEWVKVNLTQPLTEEMPQPPSGLGDETCLPRHEYEFGWKPFDYFGLRLGKNIEYFRTTDICLQSESEVYLYNSTSSPIITVKKCCPLGYALDHFAYSEEVHPIHPCQPLGNVSWTPSFYSEFSKSRSRTRQEDVHFMLYYIGCTPKRQLPWYTFEAQYSRNSFELVPATSIRFFEDGTLKYLTSCREWKQMETKEFCIDGAQNFGDSYGKYYTGNPNHEAVVSCHDFAEGTSSIAGTTISTVYMVVMYLASVFLLLTAIVYLLLWDKQNVHGWTVFCMVISMLFMFICMATAHLYGLLDSSSFSSETETSSAMMSSCPDPVDKSECSDSHSIPSNCTDNLDQNTTMLEDTTDNGNMPSWTFKGSNICLANGIMAHFFFLSQFTWMTMVNFDLWWTFKSLEATKTKSFSKLWFYSAFAYGLPVFVVSLALILEQAFPDPESLVKVPEYGKVICFLSPCAQGVYLYYIVACLLSVNLILALTTFFNLYQYKKGANALRSSKSKEQAQNVKLMWKLFVVMGLSWIFEYISWQFTDERKLCSSENPWECLWVILDLYNILQAIFIFIIFVCKKQIVTQLSQKYPSFKSFVEMPIWSESDPMTASTAGKRIPMRSMKSGSASTSSSSLTSSTNGSQRKYDAVH